MTLDEMRLDERNTIIVTGIGCTGRMGGYLKHEAVYTLHGRTLPVAEAIKTVRPEMNVIVVAGDGDTASIGGNHLIHSIRRNAPVTVLCNNNEIYGLTGGQTGPTTPTGTKTLSSPGGNPNTPINLQGLVRSSPHALYAKTTVYHQLHMRNVIREAIEWPGFSFVDITSQCIENNGRRIGFASANDMLTFYRKTYKRAPKDADPARRVRDRHRLPAGAPGTQRQWPAIPEALPEQPAGPMASATESPGRGRRDGTRCGHGGRRAPPRRPMTRRRAARRVAGTGGAHGEALARGEDAGREARDHPRRRRSPRPASRSRSRCGPAPGAGRMRLRPIGRRRDLGNRRRSASRRTKPELEAQKAEAAAEARDLVGGAPGGDTQPVAPRTAEDAAPASVSPRARPEGGEAGGGAAQAGDHAAAAVRAEAAGREARDQPRGRDARGRDRAGVSTKIALDGVGGQGVRLIAGVMGALLARMGKEVTVLFDYDSSRARQHERRVPDLRRPADREPGRRGGGHHAQACRQGAPAHQRPQGRRGPRPRRAGRRADPVRARSAASTSARSCSAT